MVLTQSARQRLAFGQAKEAVQELRESIRLSPDFGDAHYYLGIALGGGKESLDAFTRLAVLYPQRADARHEIGRLHQAAGRNAAALAEFRKAVRLAPCNIDVKQTLGRALISAGDAVGGGAELEAAIATAPATP
jgi:Flp pilus assembly protein TadD